jgi:single-strand DNA-binding protein
MPLPAITLVGNLTADPEIKFGNDGTARTSFRVACNERRRNAAGEWVDGDTTYLSVTVWRSAAETAAEALAKGVKVVVTGRLKSRTVEHPEHGRQTYYDVDADTVALALQPAHKATGTSDKPSDDPWGEQATGAPF